MHAEPNAPAEPLLAAPNHLGGDRAQLSRVGARHRVGDERRAQRVPSELGAIDLKEIVQVRVDVAIGIVREGDRRDARVEERLVIGIAEIPDGLRVVAMQAAVVGDVRLRVEADSVPVLRDVRRVRCDHVVDDRLHDVVEKMKAGRGKARHVLCAHDVE